MEEDDDDDDVPYNPKNLPLGWDGKVWAPTTNTNSMLIFISSFLCAAHSLLAVQAARIEHKLQLWNLR